MKNHFFLLPLIFLVGCQQKSEVDKCMDAMWEHQLTIQDLQIKSGVIEKNPLPKELEQRLKLENRFKCMKAQAGKD